MTKPKTAPRAKTAKAPAKQAPRKPEAQPQPPAPATLAPIERPKSKLAILIDLLQRAEGMTIAQAIEATSWQAHSVRGALAGSIKKKLGHDVASEKVDGQRIYRIAPKAD
jgi:hypothetical protein